jgi:hypothetical protein
MYCSTDRLMYLSTLINNNRQIMLQNHFRDAVTMNHIKAVKPNQVVTIILFLDGNKENRETQMQFLSL